MTFRARHLLGVEQLAPDEITTLLDLAESYVALNRRTVKHGDALDGLTQINLFFENSTRTQSSFELAGKRLDIALTQLLAGEALSRARVQALIEATGTLHANSGPEMAYRLTENGRCRALDALAARQVLPPFAVLCPFTTRPQKHWFEDRWAGLAEAAPLDLGTLREASIDRLEAMEEWTRSLAGVLTVGVGLSRVGVVPWAPHCAHGWSRPRRGV